MNNSIDERNKELFLSCKKQGTLSEETFKNLTDNKHKPKKTKSDATTDSPKISVIIPSHNRPSQLRECINSIQKQSFKNIEIIIVDDCSNEETRSFYKTLDKGNIRVLFNKSNLGSGFSRIRGLKESTGNYIIFCDDDDFYLDDNFFKEAANALREARVESVYANSFTYDDDADEYRADPLNLPSNIQTKSLLAGFQTKYRKPKSTFTAVFRRASLIDNGALDMKMLNDSSIYIRSLLSDGVVSYINRYVGAYRIHSGNISKNIDRSFLEDNLKEKINAFEIIKTRQILKSPSKWLQEQVLLTAKWYIADSNPKKKDVQELCSWIKTHVPHSLVTRNKIYAYYIIHINRK